MSSYPEGKEVNVVDYYRDHIPCNLMLCQDFRSYTSVSELSEAIVKTKEIVASKDPEFTARMDTNFHPMCEINKLTKEATTLKRYYSIFLFVRE